MPEGLIDKLQSIGLIVGGVLGTYYVILWIAAIIWTYRDIHARTEDLLAQVLAVVLIAVSSVAFPAALLVYVILRPRQTLVERYERTLEEEFMRRDIEEDTVCSNCQRPIEHDFILCPYCQTSLRRRCLGCDRTVDLTWAVCPYCATPAGHNGSLSYAPTAMMESVR